MGTGSSRRCPGTRSRRCLASWRLALAGGAATEEAPATGSYSAHRGQRSEAFAATAALPFVVALAADPEAGARVDLVGLLVAFAHATRTARPDLVDAGWTAAWRRHRGAAALLADPDPDVRREAIPLADGVLTAPGAVAGRDGPGGASAGAAAAGLGRPPRRHKRMPGRSRRCGRSSTASCVTASPS